MNASDVPVGPVERLAETRAQLLLLLDPAVGLRPGRPPEGMSGQFPRSATLRFLIGGPGKGGLGLLLLGGLLGTRRASIGRWSRYASVGSIVARALIARAAGRRSSPR
jgi:hypothetical protein